MKLILPLLADIANGIFAVATVAFFMAVEPEWWYFLIGVGLALSPDIDALPELLKRGKVSASAEHSSDHRTFLHYPIVAIGLGFTLALIFGFWGWVWLLAVSLHLINDIYGTGWGVPSFWPLSGTHYKILGRRVNRLKKDLVNAGDWNNISEPERKLRFVVRWQERELTDYIIKWGVDDWIESWYLKLNWINGVEYLLFIVAVIILWLNI